jgi:DnaJ-class molecular chaperone
MGDFEDIYAESGTHDDAADFLGGDEKTSGGAKDDDIFGAIGGTEDGDAGGGGGGGGGGGDSIAGNDDDDDDDDDDGVEISFSEAPSGNNARSSAPTQVSRTPKDCSQCLLPPAIRFQATAP